MRLYESDFSGVLSSPERHHRPPQRLELAPGGSFPARVIVFHILSCGGGEVVPRPRRAQSGFCNCF